MEMDAIYREYSAFVYKYLLTLCHDESIAEELTQETFCRAIRSVHRFDGSCKVTIWLCQIAKHKMWNYLGSAAKLY